MRGLTERFGFHLDKSLHGARRTRRDWEKIRKQKEMVRWKHNINSESNRNENSTCFDEYFRLFAESSCKQVCARFIGLSCQCVVRFSCYNQYFDIWTSTKTLVLLLIISLGSLFLFFFRIFSFLSFAVFTSHTKCYHLYAREVYHWHTNFVIRD